jgi:hypothetical protein
MPNRNRRIVIIGHQDTEVTELRKVLHTPAVHYTRLPKAFIDNSGKFMVEHPSFIDQFIETAGVIFHGVYDDDLPFLNAVAISRTPCFPGSMGLIMSRDRMTSLNYALARSEFAGNTHRRWQNQGVFKAENGDWVAKHYGKGKILIPRYTKIAVDQPTLFEEFLIGTAIRVVSVKGATRQAFQINMAGYSWKKEASHDCATLSDGVSDLCHFDTLNLQDLFRLRFIGVDYIIREDNNKKIPHLLEVNAIPDITRFSEIQTAYVDAVRHWANTKVPIQYS